MRAQGFQCRLWGLILRNQGGEGYIYYNRDNIYIYIYSVICARFRELQRDLTGLKGLVGGPKGLEVSRSKVLDFHGSGFRASSLGICP